MARIARAAARGYPHPIPERGKRRRGTFFGAAVCRAPCARLATVHRGNRAAERPYDGRNRRITKTVGETATHFFFNESWQVLETRVGADPDPLDQYVWDIRYIDAAVVRFHDADTNGSYENAGDNILYYTQDANFNTTALVDEATGEVVERYLYDLYGKATVLDEVWQSVSNNESAYANEVLYGGYGLDTESGLYHTDAREYHCSLGRFIQVDPAGDIDGSNLYQYCVSNPVALVDPLGLASGRVANYTVPSPAIEPLTRSLGIDPATGRQETGLTQCPPENLTVTVGSVTKESEGIWKATFVLGFKINMGLLDSLPSEAKILEETTADNWYGRYFTLFPTALPRTVKEGRMGSDIRSDATNLVSRESVQAHEDTHKKQYIDFATAAWTVTLDTDAGNFRVVTTSEQKAKTCSEAKAKELQGLWREGFTAAMKKLPAYGKPRPPGAHEPGRPGDRMETHAYQEQNKVLQGEAQKILRKAQDQKWPRVWRS
jgi:RHS repeat-associated protein